MTTCVTATGLARGTRTPIGTLYDGWQDLLNPQKNASINDRRSGKKHTRRRGPKIYTPITRQFISFGDVPWPCDGDANDMLAVMLTGEETTSSTSFFPDIPRT